METSPKTSFSFGQTGFLFSENGGTSFKMFCFFRTKTIHIIINDGILSKTCMFYFSDKILPQLNLWLVPRMNWFAVACQFGGRGMNECIDNFFSCFSYWTICRLPILHSRVVKLFFFKYVQCSETYRVSKKMYSLSKKCINCH